MSKPTHMQVFFTGKCTRCHHYNEVLSHDYGLLPLEELETAMDHVKHLVKPMVCAKCKREFPVEFLVYRDVCRNNAEIMRSALNHDYIDAETGERMQQGHKDRHLIFDKHQASFWDGFIDYAIGNWMIAVAELTKAEIAQGFSAIHDERTLKTDTHARREAQKVIGLDREVFWRAANQDFIYELIDIGAMGWTALYYSKTFGSNRTRFGITHLPIGEGLERLRTKHMGLLFKRDRGDNAFLLRRIAQLTEDAAKQSRRYNELVRQNDEKKHSIADLQVKIGELNAAHADLANQQPVQERSADDIRQIRQLKSFVGELLHELKSLQSNLPEELPDTPELIEVIPDEGTTDQLYKLKGKTIGIIGGWRKRTAAGDYPCIVLTHDGRKQDPAFYSLLDQSDIVVILTRFVSHASMWVAKSHVVSEDKPVYYVSEINMERILDIVAANISSQKAQN